MVRSARHLCMRSSRKARLDGGYKKIYVRSLTERLMTASLVVIMFFITWSLYMISLSNMWGFK